MVLLIFIFWLRREACGILVPQPGMEPVPPALGAQSPNLWTTREVPTSYYLKNFLCTDYFTHIVILLSFGLHISIIFPSLHPISFIFFPLQQWILAFLSSDNGYQGLSLLSTK